MHAVLLTWEAFNASKSLVMSTEPELTRDNFPRDMQWGQANPLGKMGRFARALSDSSIPYASFFRLQILRYPRIASRQALQLMEDCTQEQDGAGLSFRSIA